MAQGSFTLPPHRALVKVNDYIHLDVRELRRKNLLRPGVSIKSTWRNGAGTSTISIVVGLNQVWLGYRHRLDGGNWEALNYPVAISWTKCNLGGERPWFICPNSGCNRRVAILLGGAVFSCRACLNAVYDSQYEPAHDRLARRADKIREKLSWPVGILEGSGTKPGHMHWKTFDRLAQEHDRLVAAAINGACSKLPGLSQLIEEI